MSEGADIERVGRTMEVLLRRAGKPVVFSGLSKEGPVEVRLDSACARDGLLPVFLVAGEAVWKELVGSGFKLEIARDEKALLGYRVDAIGETRFSAVMLSMMEASAQAVRGDRIVVDELGVVWEGALVRHEEAARAGLHVAPARGMAPR